MNHDDFLKLYKYRSLAEPYGRKTAEDIILHHRMFWQSPATFNDPFDCDPVLIFGTSTRDRSRWIKRANHNNLAYTDRYDRRRMKRDLSRKPPSKHEAEMRAAWSEWMQETSVTCFSAISDHQLMWGHYADSHRGVCFVFQEQLWGDEAWIGFDVLYSEDRPIVDFTRTVDHDIVKLTLLNKSSIWSYERERRMLKWRTPPGIFEFPENALQGVILGARISAEDREFVLALVRRRHNLRVWQAVCDPSKFQLNIVELQVP